MEFWVEMPEEKWQIGSTSLTQSQRDKVAYRRRLRAAGMQDPSQNKDVPPQARSAQFKVLQAEQRAETARAAAAEAAAA
eukprot:4880459-Pyramimonas_sp.AAC.1